MFQNMINVFVGDDVLLHNPLTERLKFSYFQYRVSYHDNY